ncbi:glycoside hydrolase family 3 C-terminal domain-containing protein [Clavibacter michiganensis subsp. phaseoli]|uniref:beta-glucosidase n=1 Tax=Clavibacter phaseoli TaxID=1734031 RepID=A0A8I0VBS5_9MICO|nr:glycoside hydrolase family 3 C-terminal domain-containing protein [Clavibacter phaseoli]
MGQTAGGALIAALALGTAGVPAAGAAAEPAAQPELESAGSAPIITVDGLRFRDLDKDGALTPYEDWRLSSGDRAADLVARMSPEERAGLLMHASLTNVGDAYDRAAFDPLLAERHITTYISRLGADAPTLAREHNALQEAAEAERWGVPLKISTDPRHGFTVTEGQTVSNGDFSPFPDPIGMGAVDDPATTLEMGRIIAAEYRAVGITEALSPQADISTEPRWTRQDGTFGSVGADVAPHVAAYVEGLQGGTDGITSDGVATVVKHWVGYGAQVDGYDSHYYYGRYAAFPGGNFAEHITPYEGAFRNQAAGIMPTYSILKDLNLGDGVIEQVGANHNEYLLQDLLRGRYGFDGVITSDWGIANDCPEACRENRPPAFFVGPWGAGMPWGVEDLTLPARYASAISAGVDIIGGSDQPQYILQAVEQGLLTDARVIEAGQRVLQQKFELGLFEDPYVDPAAADAIVGSAASRAAGLDAQQRSLTLLSDTTPATDAWARDAGDPGAPALPVRVEPGMTAWLGGVQASAARSAGFTVVDDPADADVAIVRLADPRGGDDLTDLGFTGSEADYQALVRAHDAGARTIAVPQLTRPLILGNVVEHSDAVLASYGVSDEALLNVITGAAEPEGRLPFELPSTMDAVGAQLYDVPNDSASPLFAYRAGLSYDESPTEPTPAPTPGPVEPTPAPTAAPAPGPVPTPGSSSGTTPAPAPAASGRGGLAMTGFEALPWVAGGLTLAGLGVALTLIGRRRRA